MQYEAKRHILKIEAILGEITQNNENQMFSYNVFENSNH